MSAYDFEKAAADLASSAYSTAISSAQAKLLDMALAAYEDDDAAAALTAASEEIGKLTYSDEIERYNLRHGALGGLASGTFSREGAAVDIRDLEDEPEGGTA